MRNAWRAALAAGLVAAAACGDGTSPARGTLRVRNLSPLAITELYAAPCSDQTYGANRLGAGPVLPQSEYVMSLAVGCWDVLTVRPFGEQDFLTPSHGHQLAAGDTIVVDVTNDPTTSP